MQEHVLKDFAKRARSGMEAATAVGAEAMSHLAAKRKVIFFKLIFAPCACAQPNRN